METQVRRSYSAYVFAVVLFSLNIYIAHRLFTLEYPVHLESNEGSFMAISRYMAAHPFDLMWWPFWDCGLPFPNTYFPLLHMMVAAFSWLAGCSAALSFHAVCAFFYCLGPVTLYLLALAMSKRPGYSFIAALMYSLISPSALLIRAIGADAGGVWNARRLQILAYYGEGPHITAVSLLPAAILFLYLSIKHQRKRYYLIAGLLISAVVLTNAFGGVDLFLVAICLLSTVDVKAFKRNIIVTGLIAVLSYLWISPWIPPSLLRVIRLNSQSVGANYAFTVRSLLGVLILLAAFGLVWISTRSPRFPVHLRFFILFAILSAGIPWLAYAADIFVVPQPHRYQVEMEMTLCLAIVFGLQPLLDRTPLRLRQALVAGVLILGYVQTIHYVRYARKLIQPVDMERTAEYKIARWMGQHYGGQRVMITGSISFWFNVFVDTPQFHGGHDPNVPNWIHRIALFTIFSGMNTGSRDAEISLLWLRAFGAEAITVPGPASREYYHPILNPKKFDGVLPLLWREGDDSIYGIPNRSPSLAHVVSAQAIVTRPPINGLDIEQLTRYVAALEDPAYPLAALSWHNFHSARIETAAQPGQVLSIQITYAPGWQAIVNGAGRPIQKDGLGLMVLDPTCHGPCTIEMFYDGGTELKVARMASITVMLGVLAWYIGLFARRPAPAGTAI
jgi:hypothetical protein